MPRDTKLLIGMTLDVNVVVAERSDALLLPSSAVLHDAPEGGRPGPAFVYRVIDGRAVRTPVVLGTEGAASTELRSGIAESDLVIDNPATSLIDTRRVAPRP